MKRASFSSAAAFERVLNETLFQQNNTEGEKTWFDKDCLSVRFASADDREQLAVWQNRGSYNDLDNKLIFVSAENSLGLEMYQMNV